MFEVEIAKGVEYLDQDLGPSWPERIELDTLELNDCLVCLIGQLYGNFYRRFTVEEGFAFGFSLDDGYQYPELEAEWKAKIVQLRAERNVK